MKFSFQEKGTGETIVLIHSYLWDSEMWREQIDLLSKKYHCLAIDLPSHGKENFDLKKGYSLSDLANTFTGIFRCNFYHALSSHEHLKFFTSYI